MKYIRTEDGRIINRLSDFNCFKSHGTTGRYIVKTLEDDNDLELWLKYNRTSMAKQADTIEELCDEFVLVNEYRFKKPKTATELEKDFDEMRSFYTSKDDKIYGAIWTKGEHDEPILKSVAKMKGVLPNGEIDWELL